MSFTEHCNEIFNQAIRDYHIKDCVDTPINNPYDRESIENRLYLKCWIDTVQWHFEDIIRDPHMRRESIGRRYHQHRKSCMGHRPPLDTRS